MSQVDQKRVLYISGQISLCVNNVRKMAVAQLYMFLLTLSKFVEKMSKECLFQGSLSLHSDAH